ncbi:MAG: carbamoyltransferase HypF [Vicinamibacterales bacterium]
MARRRFTVRGVVQGVGFRPFVAGLARRLALVGFVRNDSGAVVIEVEGPEPVLDAFAGALTAELPPLAAIDSIAATAREPLGDSAFHIDPSAAAGGRRTSVPPDVATCAACLAELRDPHDRRFAYPFLNCTHCGPRFTIIESLPYDRATTTMRRFGMCDACRAEYEDPGNRRYHAEPTACPDCGPHVWFEGGATRVERAAAIDTARAWVHDGSIVALKGIGGFHLACDASHDAAVSELRRRKGRGDKPFALMAPSLDAVRRLCHVSDDEAAQLESRARPIVLVRRREGSGVSPHVAPGQDHLGVMLPYSPLHHLLVTDGPWVLTSGNRSDEPIARDNDEARTRLASLADAFLFHDRDIHAVCDDSVVRVARGAPLPIRRSRGFAPFPVRLPFEVPPVLAVGGELKATFCVAAGHDAYLSQHIGDMETVETLTAFERAVDHLLRLFDIAPSVVAVDHHPGYLSSQWGSAWAAARGLPVVRVQHHHAHHAAILAEHGIALDQQALGLIFDGTGYGLDGTVWGGEALAGGYTGIERAARLGLTPLPASDADVRHGFRLALAHLAAAGVEWDDDLPPVRACAPADRAVLARRFAQGIGMVGSSSMGRLFDAVASLCGVRHASAYEAQAAIELEAAARGIADDDAGVRYGFARVALGGPVEWLAAPLIHAIVDDVRAGVSIGRISARFHDAVARLGLQMARDARATEGVDIVGLSGGVFQNVRLLDRTVALLEADGFRVLTHRLVPPNDGGLSLGQAVYAAQSVRLPAAAPPAA